MRILPNKSRTPFDRAFEKISLFARVCPFPSRRDLESLYGSDREIRLVASTRPTDLYLRCRDSGPVAALCARGLIALAWLEFFEARWPLMREQAMLDAHAVANARDDVAFAERVRSSY